jgi:hypothetical protein
METTSRSVETSPSPAVDEALGSCGPWKNLIAVPGRCDRCDGADRRPLLNYSDNPYALSAIEWKSPYPDWADSYLVPISSGSGARQ